MGAVLILGLIIIRLLGLLIINYYYRLVIATISWYQWEGLDGHGRCPPGGCSGASPALTEQGGHCLGWVLAAQGPEEPAAENCNN